MNFYIWYRVRVDERETETVIRHMMSRLACRSGSSGRLLKKYGEPSLWLEVYEGVVDPTGFEHLLAQAVDEFDVEMFCEGGRHCECFEQAAVAPVPAPPACRG